MKDKCYVCKITCNQKLCAFEHNGDENICPFDARYLDLSEHDKKIKAEVIKLFEDLYNHHICIDYDFPEMRMLMDFYNCFKEVLRKVKED